MPRPSAGSTPSSFEEIRGDHLTIEVSGLASASQGESVVAGLGQGGERMILRAPVEEVGITHGADRVHRLWSAVVYRAGGYQAIGVGKGERAEQDGVDQTEDRSGCADPQRNGEDRGDRKGRRLPHLTNAEAKVLLQITHFSTPVNEDVIGSTCNLPANSKLNRFSDMDFESGRRSSVVTVGCPVADVSRTA